MSYVQVRQFDPAKMRTRPNYCLQNCRIAFDPVIPPKYEDARQAMQANKDAGTLHSMDTLPMNCAVPVFVDTPSKLEHVIVVDKGVYYSDGKIVDKNTFSTYFGWGESLNDCRVVDFVPDPEPQPEPDDGFKVGDKVIPTALIDYNGTPLIQYDPYYYITELNGDRAVLSADRNGDMEIWCAMNTNNIKKV